MSGRRASREETCRCFQYPGYKDGRVSVKETLQIPISGIFMRSADLAAINEGHGLANGRSSRYSIRCDISQKHIKTNRGLAPQPFIYKDRGSMITIGRSVAGAAIDSWSFTGYFAWVMAISIFLI